MESAINVLVSQFKAYAGKDGSANTLCKGKPFELLQHIL